MKLGFICPNIPGHLNPMTALARHLQARNHEVVFLYSPSANGLPCVPGEKDDDMNANRPEMSKLEGDGAVAFYCGVAAKETEVILTLNLEGSCILITRKKTIHDELPGLAETTDAGDDSDMSLLIGRRFEQHLKVT